MNQMGVATASDRINAKRVFARAGQWKRRELEGSVSSYSHLPLASLIFSTFAEAAGRFATFFVIVIVSWESRFITIFALIVQSVTRDAKGFLCTK